MAENIEPKIRTILILLIGAIVMLLLSYACVLDWINKIEMGRDWSVNLVYHPLSGVISIIFFTMLFIFLFERLSSGFIEKIKNFLEEKKQIIVIFLIIDIVSLILLIVNSFMILEAGTSGVEGLVAFHTLMGILLGVSIMLTVLKTFTSKYLNDPGKCENYILIIVIILLVVFIAIVAVARAMGLLTL